MKSIKVFDPNDFPKYLPKLNVLYDELFEGGKGFRAKLVQKVSHALGLEEKAISLLCQTIEFIHNASLLHDDLVDRSSFRRGKTAAWLKYTPEYAVLAGDYLLARVMVNLSKNASLELVQYTSEMISDLLEGEWIQDSLMGQINVTQEQLDHVHQLKTGSLFKWCLRSPFIFQNHKSVDVHQSLNQLGDLLGLLFQRSDDLLDFNIRNSEGKAILSDLKAGYLNSFSIFLLEGQKESLIKKFIISKSLDDVFSVLGKEFVKKRLEQFDEINAKKIEYYLHLCKHLRDLLEEKEKNIVLLLESLPEILYWRNKS